METTITWLLPDIGPLLVAIGLSLTFWTLKANHDWNRRNFAATLVGRWNDETSKHRRAIEAIRPGLVDLDTKSRRIEELTKEDAGRIYLAKPGEQEWELRFHFIELLNHFEFICAAYNSRVGDQQIIEDSFRSALVRWHDILLNFIDCVRQHRGYEPWDPFTSVVGEWKRKPLKPRTKLPW